MARARRIIPLVLFLLLIAAALGYLQTVSGPQRGPLKASGTVEAVEAAVAPEVTGRVVEVYVEKGAQVQVGDPLFRLDDSLLQAQRRQAEAALQVAQQAVQTAQVNLDAARLQAQIAQQQAHLADQATRTAAWTGSVPADFTLPGWYFTRAERIAAAQHEVEQAQQALAQEQQHLQDVLQSAAGADLLAAEERLSRARLAFQVAQTVLDRANATRDTDLQNYAQAQFDAAKSELDAAQTEYDRLLSTQAAQDVLEARARVQVAQERLDTARDRLYALQTGDQALSVQAAQMAVKQAEAALAQAQASVTQAQAQLDLIDLQLDKLTVRAPVDGVVLTRHLEPGEVVAAGVSVMTIGRLDRLTITVYLPEERYGEVHLGDVATVRVDSFPGETFSARVTRIAQQAEYTPRNVQTAEGRRSTVFAVELSVDDPTGRLKPGMPADVDFGK